MAELRFSFIQLFFRLLARQTGQIGTIDMVPQKPHFRNEPIEQPFARATPESQGVDSAHIYQYLKALHDSSEASIHQAIVIRHGKILAECSFAPYQRGMWHVTYSMCKTFTGMAAGLAIEDGFFSLNDNLEDIFPEHVKLLSRIGHKNVTIRDLLDMTSEVEYSEAGAIDSTDWRTNFLSASRKSDPGTEFDYNSMNSFMISAAIQKKSGMTMFDYLKERIFDPMGIREIFWEKNPQGITKGGWGCFIRPEDACKLGQLLLNRGKWGDRQLLPENWVQQMTACQVPNSKFGYGYQLWMEERPGGYSMNGLFGQDVVCYPDDDMILMVNAGNRELTQEGELTEIMRRFWGVSYSPSAAPLPENPREHRKLLRQIADYSGNDFYGGSGVGSAFLASLTEQKMALPRTGREARELPRQKPSLWDFRPRGAKPLTPDEMLKVLDKRTFQLEKGKAGIFPLICQVTHNNYTDGIQKIGFERRDGQMVILFYEGKTVHHVRVGFGDPAVSEIQLHGEPYYIGTSGRISTDEYDRVVLLLDIAFIEEACRRKINLYFSDNDIEARFSETPGDVVIADALTYTAKNPDLFNLPIIKQILKEGGMDFLDVSIQATIHPVDHGKLITAENGSADSHELN